MARLVAVGGGSASKMASNRAGRSGGAQHELVFVLTPRRRGDADSGVVARIWSFLQELRGRRWFLQRRCSRELVPWCMVCGSRRRFQFCFVDDVVDGSSGSGTKMAWGMPRSTRHSDSAPPVTVGISFDSQSQVWRWCDLGLLGRWWFGSFSGVPRRRWWFSSFVMVVVLGHFVLLELSRDFCVCTTFVCVL